MLLCSRFFSGLPANTDFDFFSIQIPVAPFGLSWYVGDIETDEHGDGVGHFVGRFNIETFILSPGDAGPSPNVFRSPPASPRRDAPAPNLPGRPAQTFPAGTCAASVSAIDSALVDALHQTLQPLGQPHRIPSLKAKPN